MTLSVGLWDRLFGKKATLDVPDGDGNTLQRKVSVNWLREMEHQGKISLLGTPIRVHLLDPFDIKNNGYRIEEWIVGRDLEQEQYDRFKDPNTGDLHAVIAYHDGKSTTMTIHKPMFVEHLAEFHKIGIDKILNQHQVTIPVHHIDSARTDEYYQVEEWVLGEDIDDETYEKNKDPVTGELYVVTFDKDGDSHTVAVSKEKFDGFLTEFKQNGLL